MVVRSPQKLWKVARSLLPGLDFIPDQIFTGRGPLRRGPFLIQATRGGIRKSPVDGDARLAKANGNRLSWRDFLKSAGKRPPQWAASPDAAGRFKGLDLISTGSIHYDDCVVSRKVLKSTHRVSKTERPENYGIFRELDQHGVKFAGITQHRKEHIANLEQMVYDAPHHQRAFSLTVCRPAESRP